MRASGSPHKAGMTKEPYLATPREASLVENAAGVKFYYSRLFKHGMSLRSIFENRPFVNAIIMMNMPVAINLYAITFLLVMTEKGGRQTVNGEAVHFLDIGISLKNFFYFFKILFFETHSAHKIT